MAITSTLPSAGVQTVAPTRPSASQATTPAQFASQAADRTLGARTSASAVQTGAGADASTDGTPVAKYAQDRVGTVEGNGECFTLADNALKANGFKSASDYGRVTPNADYKWGKPVPLNESKSGDVLQFRDYKNTTRTDQADGAWQSESQERPHHTAIVVANDGKGNITVLEQNVPHGGEVKESVLHFGNGKTKGDDGSTTTQKTTGTVVAYHPEKK